MLNTKGSGKLQQPKHRTIKHSDPSGIKVWVTPSGIEAGVTEGLAEGSCTEEGAGEGNRRYRLRPRDQTQGLWWLHIFSWLLHTSLFACSQSSQFTDTVSVTLLTL